MSNIGSISFGFPSFQGLARQKPDNKGLGSSKTGSKFVLPEQVILEMAKKSGSSASAKNAGQSYVAATQVTQTATSGTLWQAQSYAQSEDASAIDVEYEDQPATPSAADKFKEFMKKTPEEMIRDGILKELGLSEEDIDALPPEERKIVEEKIEDRLEEKMEQALKEKGAGIDLDMAC